VATGAGSGAAPAPAAPAPAQPLNVNMANFAFGPKELTVKAGTTVTFVNGDRATHTATADGGQFDTGNIAAGNSGSITLSQAGTFRFFCKLHGAAGGQGMSGTVTVQP
jgi:plastocyanin